MMVEATPNPRPWRRCLRVSVRGLIVLVLVIGGGMGWIVRSAREQFAAVKAIQAVGGNVWYEWDWTNGHSIPTGEPWWPKWLVKRVGVDYLGSVVRVGLFFNCTDKELVHVGRLGQMDTLSLPGARISDTGLANLAGLQRLETLNLWGNKITDAGLVHLKTLHKLRWLCLDQTDVTDSGLRELTGLTNLQTLSLEKTRVTDAGVQELQKNLPRLKIIR
jgi:internalin A